MGKIAYVTAVVAGVAVIGAAVWYSNRSTVLSQEPVRKGVAETVPGSESTLGVRVAVPFDVLNSAVNGLLPTSFTKDENGEDVCLIGICAGTQYKFTASRSPIAFSHESGKLRGTVSLEIEGKGGFRGDGAKLLDLDEKNFAASADIAVVASLSVTPGWCPEVNATVSYNWTKTPRVEYISGKYVTIQGIAEDAINDSLKTLPDKLKEAIPCDAIKAAAAKAWRNYAVPVQIPRGPMLHVAIHPKQVGTSGLIVTDENLRVAVGVVSDVSVSTKAEAEQPLGPLPDLGQVPDSAGKLDVSLPLRAEYGPLNEALLAAVIGKSFEFAVGSGQGTVQIKEAEVFPSEGKIGLELGFSADLPGRIFNTSGTVYATAKLTPDETGQVIRLTDFGYSRILDNGVWSALSAVFEGQIRQQIERKGRIDLKPHLEKGREALREAISDPAKTNGIKIEVEDPDAKIVAITPADDHLAILTRITGTLDTTVVDPKIAN
ncbi:DUF4403 family protein [Rhizobium leguminosarum bv. viciae]|uniref:DUF4403 family protein n=1 Tax=Rhizobium leguminosarum TaxID=384 RepID=UPI001040C2BB|nr:DUF4403 family protein [Rhizobium leguminosarum]TBZ30955.1 DUF4403 family protein [Rhizobium leguminosarum bv. viciae]